MDLWRWNKFLFDRNCKFIFIFRDEMCLEEYPCRDGFIEKEVTEVCDYFNLLSKYSEDPISKYICYMQTQI